MQEIPYILKTIVYAWNSKNELSLSWQTNSQS